MPVHPLDLSLQTPVVKTTTLSNFFPNQIVRAVEFLGSAHPGVNYESLALDEKNRFQGADVFEDVEYAASITPQLYDKIFRFDTNELVRVFGFGKGARLQIQDEFMYIFDALNLPAVKVKDLVDLRVKYVPMVVIQPEAEYFLDNLMELLRLFAFSSGQGGGLGLSSAASGITLLTNGLTGYNNPSLIGIVISAEATTDKKFLLIYVRNLGMSSSDISNAMRFLEPIFIEVDYIRDNSNNHRFVMTVPTRIALSIRTPNA